ncbi:22213_t:CDS:10 [Entrophospora sp. SA101]|nr:22213_t:CDS:10 [Entrophospora sp. SA101]
MAMHSKTFTAKVFINDTVCSIKNEEKTGIITKTWHNFEDMLQAAPIKRNHVYVSWLTGSKSFDVPQLVHEDHIKSPNDMMSGTITNVNAKVDIRHNISNQIIRNVDTRHITYCWKLREGEFVIYNNWLGTIEEVFDQITVQFHDGNRFAVGEVVWAPPRDFQNGRYLKGNFSSKHQKAIVIDSSPFKVKIRWISQNPMVGNEKTLHASLPPTELTDLKNLIPFKRYYENSTFELGDKVIFNTPEDAKFYNLNYNVPGESAADTNYTINSTTNSVDEAANSILINTNTVNTNSVNTKTTKTTGKFDYPGFNLDTIMKLTTSVDVEWQDMSHSCDISSIELIPYLNVDDHDMYPSDYVLKKNTESGGEERLGIVQSVNAIDRTAKIRWFRDNIDMELEETEDELSLYELVAHPELQYELGDKVLIRPKNSKTNISDLKKAPPSSMFYQTIEELADVLFHRTSENVNNEANDSDEWRTATEDEDEDEDEKEIKANSNYYSNRFAPLMNYKSIEEEEEIIDDEMEDDDMEEKKLEEKMNGRRQEDKLKTIKDEEGTTISKIGTNEIAMDDDTKSKETLVVNPKNEEISTHSTIIDKTMTEEKSECSSDMYGKGSNFVMLDEAPSDHIFIGKMVESQSSFYIQRVLKEHRILNGILVKAFSDRLDLLRVLIFGPQETPYEDAPFLFDFSFPNNFPNEPPVAHFHSWTGGIGRINPNLYEEGKVCLSLLNTWTGKDETEMWTPLSSMLQLLISLQALVLNQSPWYNEAGFDKFVGSEEAIASSALYNERAYLLSLRAISFVLKNTPKGLEEDLEEFYIRRGILKKVIGKAYKIINKTTTSTTAAITTNGNEEDLPVSKISKGAIKLLTGIINNLHDHLKQQKEDINNVT